MSSLGPNKSQELAISVEKSPSPILIVARNADTAAPLREALAPAGWPVLLAGSVTDGAVMAASSRPWLILIPAHRPDESARVAAALRDAPAPFPSIPVILVGGSLVRAAGIDDHLAWPCPPDAAIAKARLWHRPDALAGVRRLEQTFGRDAIAHMVAGFRAQLAEAVERLDAAGDTALAHRIAGIAGTLGFTAVGARWLALSGGDGSARHDARREARIAIAAIDRQAVECP